jgi:hypothetical protein
LPFYDYKCRNEKCETVKDGNSFITEKMCSMKDRNILPECSFCGRSMPRFFGNPPSISWRYLNANGVWTTSSMGPDQRADRRLQKYVDGRAIWRPIYGERRKGK